MIIKTPNYKITEFEDFRMMLEKEKSLEAIVCATPDNTHAYVSINSMRAGKHVYCEKSPALTEEELNLMYDSVTNSKIVYQLGHQIPQSVIFQQAKETLDAQRARGVENRKNPVYRLVKLGIPVLRRTFERADKLASAMEARCYSENRTDSLLSSGVRDWISLVGVVCLCLIIIL